MAQPQQGYGYPPPVENTGNYPPQGYPPPQQGYPPPQGQAYPPAQQQPGGYGPAQPGYAPPATQQPGYGAAPAQGQGMWMPAPQPPPNCPPGLEYLTQINQLLIQQKVELLEAFTGFESNNKYKVTNNLGQQVYFAAEDTDCCTRQCCGPGRPFEMKIMDNFQREVIHLSRPLRCSSCWFPLYSFVICIFQVLSADGQNEVGKISKQWTGLVKEAFTDADNCSATL